MNKEGAIAGMIAGIGFTFSYIVYFQFMGGVSEQYLFSITPEGIGFIGMIINFIISFIVCMFTSSQKMLLKWLKKFTFHLKYGNLYIKLL